MGATLLFSYKVIDVSEWYLDDKQERVEEMYSFWGLGRHARVCRLYDMNKIKHLLDFVFRKPHHIRLRNNS